jgi:hypothetical protein
MGVDTPMPDLHNTRHGNGLAIVLRGIFVKPSGTLLRREG